MSPATSSDVGLYIHFPYCEKKCPYCDFNSHAIDPEHVRYADAVIEELEERANTFGTFSTVYFGGGTPSLWDAGQVARVLRWIRPRLLANAEITLEANPGTVEDSTFEDFVGRGVTRFSIGVQSFSTEELVWLGRIHDAASARRAVKSAMATGARVSLDLIYGLPGQTRESVERSIDEALALDPGHVSAYTLTIEPETHFGRAFAAGRLPVMDDDGQAELIDLVTERLERASYRRYEISSYAKPGLEAVHNTIYWMGGPYLGVGAGASSYLPKALLRGAERRENVKAPAAYLSTARSSLARIERLDRRATIADRLWTAVRTVWGLDLDGLEREARLDPSIVLAIEDEVGRLTRLGWVTYEGGWVRPTAEGFKFADGIGRALLAAIGEARLDEAPVDPVRDPPLRDPPERRTLSIVE
ncbi:MAG: radical SAM family heme chaperone HemW [Deltaproteobacteria bacterium]|nr:radical SAM family heme chaperone HemW [Deltaproteobacteria bacterium]